MRYLAVVGLAVLVLCSGAFIGCGPQQFIDVPCKHLGDNDVDEITFEVLYNNRERKEVYIQAGILNICIRDDGKDVTTISGVKFYHRYFLERPILWVPSAKDKKEWDDYITNLTAPKRVLPNSR